MAVTFSQRANAAVRKVLFADAIGWSAIPVLAVLAGLVVRLVLSRERLVHDEPRSGVRVRRAALLVARGIIETRRLRKVA